MLTDSIGFSNLPSERLSRDVNRGAPVNVPGLWLQVRKLEPDDWKRRSIRNTTRARYRDIFSASPTAMAVCDEKGRLTEVNRAFLDTLGWAGVRDDQVLCIPGLGDLFDDGVRGLLPNQAVRRTLSVDLTMFSPRGMADAGMSTFRLLDLTITRLGNSAQDELSCLVQVHDAVNEWNICRSAPSLDGPGRFLARFSADGRLSFANESFCAVFELDPENVSRSVFLDCVHLDDRERARLDIGSLSMSEPTGTFEYKSAGCCRPVQWVRWTFHALHDGKDDRARYTAIGKDITTRTESEEGWKKYEFIVNASKEFMALIDRNGFFEAANEAFCRAVGNRSSEILGRSVFELCGKETFHRKIKEFLDRCFEGAELHEEVWYPASAHGTRCYDVRAYPYVGERGVVSHVVVVSRDITERRRAVEALEESEERFRFLAENTGDAIYRLKYDSMDYDYLGPAIKKLTGYSADEIDAVRFSSLVIRIEMPGEGSVSADAIIRKRQKGETGEYQADYLITKKDGAQAWLRDHSFPWLDASGNLMGSVGVLTDVTRRKQAEKALLDSEERFRNIAGLSPFPIAILDARGRFLYLNQRFVELFGYTLAELPSIEEWFALAFPHPACREEILRLLRVDLERAAGYEVVTRLFEVVCRDGAVREILFRVVKMENGDRFITCEDRTEQRRMQEERIRVSKLESIGVLAGGIAHDFNNILTAVLGNISLAAMAIKRGAEAGEKLIEAEKGCLRAKSLTQQLLAFSKGGDPVKRLLVLPGFLRETVRFALAGSSVHSDFYIEEDLWCVECDEGRMAQVINNLVLNAKEAMPGGGRIQVHAANVVLDGKESLPLKDGRYVEISVRDAGAGIPENILPRIFDPYFTTKQRGSGLGLATSYSIVRKHGGYIRVQSREGYGTTFRVLLPAVESREESEEEIGRAKHGRFVRSKGRILVMDDEDIVLNRTYNLLRHLGYEVELARDGLEAIEVYKEAMGLSTPFDCVIIDLDASGGPAGEDTVQNLREIDPEFRAIVSSDGARRRGASWLLKKEGVCGVVSKPYRAEELASVLADVLKLRNRPG